MCMHDLLMLYAWTKLHAWECTDMHGRPFSGIGNPDVCMGMSHAYKRQSINTFIHTHAYTVIHAYHLVVHAYSCIHPMPICHAYQSGDRHHGRMHTYMDAMHVYMHTLIYILMHILIHTYAYPNNFHRILFIPCSHIIFHALHPLCIMTRCIHPWMPYILVLSFIHASIFLCTHSFILMHTHTVSNFPPNFIHTMLTYSLPCPQSPPRLCIVQVAQLLSSWLVSSSSICDACILSSLAQSIPHLFT